MKGISKESYLQKKQLTASKGILSFKEALAYMDVSESFLYKLTSNQMIRYSKPNGGKIYFQLSDLNNWMLKNTKETIEDRLSVAEDYLKANAHENRG